MRLPTYVYRSRYGIYFFRIVVPLALRNALSGQREIKRSLRTRDKRQALVQARALALDLYPVFAKAVAMSKLNSPPSLLDVLPAAANGRKLTITGPQVMPDGSTIPYTIKTDSDSPHELEAAKAAAVKLHALHHSLTQNRPKEPNAEEWAQFEKEQQILRDILLPDLKTDTDTASAIPENPPPAAKGGKTSAASSSGDVYYNDPDHFIGALWPQFASQQQGSEWRAPRTFKANNRMFNTFLAWAEDRDVRTINKVLISQFKDYLRTKAKVRVTP